MFKCPECDHTHNNIVEKCENCGYELELDIEKLYLNISRLFQH